MYRHSHRDLALSSWLYSSSFFAENDDRNTEYNCLRNIGTHYGNLGEFGKAIEYTERSLNIAKQIGDDEGEATCYADLVSWYSNVTDSHRKSGNTSKVIEYTERLREVANGYTLLGLSYTYTGTPFKAIEYHSKSLEIAKKIGARDVESICYGNLGGMYCILSDFSNAIKYSKRSLKVSKQIRDESQESNSYTNLGVTYYFLGDLSKAINYHRKALKIGLKKENEYLQSKSYKNLADAYRRSGNLSDAIEYTERSLNIAKQIGDEEGKAACYDTFGSIYSELGNPSKAMKYHRSSLKIAEKIGHKHGEAGQRINIGFDYYLLGNYSKAVESFEKALTLGKMIGDVGIMKLIYLNLGRVNTKIDPNAPYSFFAESIELSELVGTQLIEEEHKISFYGQEVNAYDMMVPLCIEIGKDKEAFEYVERSKSKAFLETLIVANPLTNSFKPRSSTEGWKSELSKLIDVRMRLNTQHIAKRKS